MRQRDDERQLPKAMTAYYVDPATGADNNPGSMQQPWKTLDHAIAATVIITPAPTVNLLQGVYQSSGRAIKTPLKIAAPNGGVQIEPGGTHTTWTQMQLGAQSVWHATLGGINTVWQATWQAAIGEPVHRVPVWANAAPMDTAQKWGDAILSDSNPYTRWGLYQQGTDLYLIPPYDGSWADPNSVRIILGRAPGLWIDGPDVQVTCDPGGIWIIGSGESGIRLDAHAQRVVIDGPRISCTARGIGVYGGSLITPTGWMYGDGHVFRNLLIEDDLTWQAPGEAPNPRQTINWYAIKSVIDFGFKDVTGTALLVRKPLGSAETVAFYTSGGATNMLIEDCMFDGSFDGLSNWATDGQFDHQANLNLLVRRCAFRNHGDDSVDISRHSYGVVFEDCTFCNVGTIDSAAPFWGTRTFRRCQGWLIGDQVRPPDALGRRPPGSVWKLGGLSAADPQGATRHENCCYWTATPTTQGVSQDGGLSAKTVRLEIVNTTVRVGSIAVNWPYGPDYFVDQGNTWATSSTRPLKTSLPITLTPAAQVDARYYDPAHGDFSDMSKVEELQTELDAANQLISELHAQAQDASAKQLVIDQLVALGTDALVTWQALRQQATRSP